MKNLLIALILILAGFRGVAQSDTLETYKVVKTDGGEFVGQILKQDDREVLLKISDGRKIYIPQHNILKMIKLDSREFNSKGEFLGDAAFSTRYFISTNGLPIKKGEGYILWNWYGPDVQIGLGNNIGVGVITTWIGAPVIATVKKSWKLNEVSQVAVGGLFGTGSWGAYKVGGALPYASLSFGNSKNNLAISGGYGAIVDGYNDNNVNGRAMTSVAGMCSISKKVSFVFETFVFLPEMEKSEFVESSALGLILPGIRFQQAKGKSLQLGFGGLVANKNVINLPMVQWFRTF